jgi:hypothetical protein
MLQPPVVDHDKPDGMLRLRTAFAAQQDMKAKDRNRQTRKCSIVSIPPLQMAAPSSGRKDTFAFVVVLSENKRSLFAKDPIMQYAIEPPAVVDV